MKKIIAAAVVAVVAVAGAAVAATECTVEAVEGAKVTVACEGLKAGEKVSMKAGEKAFACVVDSADKGKAVLTCEAAEVKAGDKVAVEAAAAEKKEEAAPATK